MWGSNVTILGVTDGCLQCVELAVFRLLTRSSSWIRSAWPWSSSSLFYLSSPSSLRRGSRLSLLVEKGALRYVNSAFQEQYFIVYWRRTNHDLLLKNWQRKVLWYLMTTFSMDFWQPCLWLLCQSWGIKHFSLLLFCEYSKRIYRTLTTWNLEFWVKGFNWSI